MRKTVVEISVWRCEGMANIRTRGFVENRPGDGDCELRHGAVNAEPDKEGDLKNRCLAAPCVGRRPLQRRKSGRKNEGA